MRPDLTVNTLLFSKWEVTELILVPQVGINISNRCLGKVMRSYEEASRCFASQTNFHQWWASCVFIKNVIKTSQDYMRLTINHVNNHWGGVAAAGSASVVPGVIVSRLGHYQSTLGPLVVRIIPVIIYWNY